VQRLMREAQEHVNGAVAEIQAQCRGHRAEVEAAQRENSKKFEENIEQTQRNTLKLRQVEHSLESQAKESQRAATSAATQWYDQLEGVVSALERRVGEQQTGVETFFSRVCADLEGFRVRLEDRHQHADERMERIEKEFLSVKEQKQSGASLAEQRVDELARRLDQAESKNAAVRVRVDSYEGRLAGLAERMEQTLQSSLDASRQLAARLREDVLAEVECQLRILRQRVEATGELCEELSFRELRSANWPKQVLVERGEQEPSEPELQGEPRRRCLEEWHRQPSTACGLEERHRQPFGRQTSTSSFGSAPETVIDGRRSPRASRGDDLPIFPR